MKDFYKKFKESRGAALLIILALSAVIIPLIQSVFLDSQLEYQHRRYRLNALQARYNAQAGLDLSLLRVYLFKGVEKSLPANLEVSVRPFLNQIWYFPFAWPLPESEDFLESEKQDLKKSVQQSFLKGSYGTSLSPEDGRLDINDLSNSLTPLREFNYSVLLNLLLKVREEREDFKDKYSEKDFEVLLNNLSDWTDEDNDSQNGGREELQEEGKKPLNRSFISVEEIKKVPGMTPDLFDILRPYVTVYGSKSLNINYTNEEILEALNINPNLVDQILLRTQIQSGDYQPFSSEKDFCDFLQKFGSDFCTELRNQWGSLDMLSFSLPMAFRIKSSGIYRNQSLELEALISDLSPLSLNYQKSLYYEKQRQEQEKGEESPPPEPEDKPAKSPSAPKESKIDYSYYKSLIIMYVKER